MTTFTFEQKMDQSRKCACKGIRSCLLCEKPEQTAGGLGTASANVSSNFEHNDPAFFYQCHHCGKILREDETVPELDAKPLLRCTAGGCGPELRVIRIEKEASELCHSATVPEGVTVIKEFVSSEEEREIVSEIDRSQWAESQSGRRKQVIYDKLEIHKDTSDLSPNIKTLEGK